MPRKFESEIAAFGEIISHLRLKAGLTQKQLAERCEVDVRTIRRVEKGQIAIGFETIMGLSEALNVPAYQLFHFGN